MLTISKPVPRESQDKPAATENPENPPESSDENSSREKNEEPYIPTATTATERHLMSDQDYNDLVRDLGLSSRQTEILASRLKQWNFVERDFKVTCTRDRNLTSFEQIFKDDDTDNKLVYCIDVNELFVFLNYEHCPKDWRLFLDGSHKSEYVISIPY